MDEKIILASRLKVEEFIKSHNGVEDLFNEEELNEYKTLSWPDNVPMLYDRLKKRIEEDPEYEIWLPAEYVTFSLRENDVVSHFTTQYQFVSNRGRYFNLMGRKKKPYQGHDTHGYRYATIKLEGKPNYTSVGIHRLVATVFVPKPDHLKEKPHHLLEVNHASGIKSDNLFTNLEWCTSKENSVHSRVTGLKVERRGLNSPLTTPIVGTCVIPGHLGKEIMFAGTLSIKAMGFSPIRPLVSAKTKGAISYGCTWRYATNDDIINHNNAIYDADFIKALKCYNVRLKSAIVGTNKLTGHMVLFVGSDDMENQGFSNKGVYAVISGKQLSYKGYSFKRVPLEGLEERKKQIIENNELLEQV